MREADKEALAQGFLQRLKQVLELIAMRGLEAPAS
jgi:hypothetical protein